MSNFHSPCVSKFRVKTVGKQTKAVAEIYAEIPQEKTALRNLVLCLFFF